MSKTFGIVLFMIAACFFASADQVATKTDLTGTWVSEAKEAQAEGEITLVITQVGEEIRIKESHSSNGKVASREQTYFADERGEKNPTVDGKQELKSVAKWSGGKLIVEFSLPQTRADNRPIINERIDVWSISRDGKKLKHSSSFRRSWPSSDASNPSSLTPSISSAPLNWKTERTFKRVS